jgi:hypothetical protein
MAAFRDAAEPVASRTECSLWTPATSRMVLALGVHIDGSRAVKCAPSAADGCVT